MEKSILITICLIVILFFTTICLLTILGYSRYVIEQTRTNSLYIDKNSCSTYGDNINYALICADMISNNTDMDYFKLI